MILPAEEMNAAPARYDHAECDDPELLRLSRSGDTEAFATLFARHRDAAIRVAARTSRRLDPEDVAAEAFARVWTALSHGRGPDRAFRPYLAAAVRNVALNWCRDSRELATDPALIQDAPAEPDATSIAIAEAEFVGAAFAGLPERWRQALWATEVEGRPVHELADSLGISANAASALCLRARDGLRAAWLQAHVQRRSRDPECQWVLEHLGAHTLGRLPAGQRRRVEPHLAECARCAETRDRLAFVGGALKVSALFAGTGAAWLVARTVVGAAAGPVTATGAPLTLQPAVVPLAGRLREILPRVLGSGIPKVASVVTTAAVATAVAVTVTGFARASAESPEVTADVHAAIVAPSAPPAAEPTTFPSSPEPKKSPKPPAATDPPRQRHASSPRTTHRPKPKQQPDVRPTLPERDLPDRPLDAPTPIRLPDPPVEPAADAAATD